MPFYATETERCRQLTTTYCHAVNDLRAKGNGLDIGSGGDPVVPWAIQIELTEVANQTYSHDREYRIEPTWRGDGRMLPFRDAVMDFVYSSHLLEDFENWQEVLVEWLRVLKPGGHIILMVPDKERFNAQIARQGGGGNANHKHEFYVGELTQEFRRIGVRPILDMLTEPECEHHDYNILAVGQKL